MAWSENRKKYLCDGRTRGAFHGAACHNSGKLEHEGKKYCAQHHPPTVKKRRQQRDATIRNEIATEGGLRGAQRREEIVMTEIVDVVMLGAPEFHPGTLIRLNDLAVSYKAAKENLEKAREAYREAHR